MNKFIGMGRLGADVELRDGQNGKWGRVNMAIDRGKNRDGKDLGTDWISLVANGVVAESMAKWLGKGRKVLIEGHLRVQQKDVNGVKQTYTNIVVDRWEFADAAPRAEGQGAPVQPAPQAAPAPQAVAPVPQAAPVPQQYAPAPGSSVTDDDIPF